MAHQSSGEEDYVGDAKILRLLEKSRLAFEAGDKSELMMCVFRCARFQAVIPEWAADALLALQENMDRGRIKDFNEAFGKPGEKSSTRAARKRKEAARPAVMTVLTQLRVDGRSFNDAEMFTEALEILRNQGLNVNHRDIQEIYAEHGGPLKEIPRVSDPDHRYGTSDVTLPKPRRRGRNILRD